MVESENIFEKSSKVSTEARKCGNQLYTRKNHGEHVHKNILLQYSRSVAFAPRNSDGDELALAYSNRSALSMHLNQHERCLVDVDRALQIAKSTELRAKLETRRGRCMDAMRRSIDIDSALKNASTNNHTRSKQLPVVEPSVTMPAASEAVTVKYSEKHGRHLVASRDVDPGEMIVAETGYVRFPIVEKRHLVCSHCLSFAWNGIPCDRCAFVVYCCETCKVEAWNEYHDVECALLPMVPPLIFDKEDFLPYSLVALRLLIKAAKSEGIDRVVDEFGAASSGNGKGVEGLKVDGKFRSDKFRSCVNLLSHKNADKNEDSKNDLVVSCLVELLFHRTGLFDSQKNKNDNRVKIISRLKVILKKLTDIVNDNVFEYQAFMCECDSVSECRTRCDASRGVVLAPCSSLINHSCNSNVNRVCLPRGKVVMFTVAPVKKGEQLFGSYGTVHTKEKTHRQQFLQKFFHFSCNCQACEENWPSDPQQAEVKQSEETRVLMKIMMDFKKHFPSVLKSSVMNASEDDWQFDEETLKHAVKLSELTYKHFDNKLASYYNLHYKNYMSTAFHVIYGEQYAIPNNCYS